MLWVSIVILAVLVFAEVDIAHLNLGVSIGIFICLCELKRKLK